MINLSLSSIFKTMLNSVIHHARGAWFVARCMPLVVVALAVVADAGMPEKKISYDSFRLVRTRNIFDPDRRAMVPASVVQAAPPSPPITPADFVALNGVLMTSDRTLAFFSGSRPEYSKVLPVQGSIAGATLLKITPDSIVVDRNGKQITVAVGQTIPLDGSAPAAAPVPVDSTPASPQTSSSAAPPGNASETMRRMMERRQKELQ